MPGTDLAASWHRFGRLSHRVPGTDLAACLLATVLAPYLVPGTDLTACLQASDLAPRLVPGTDLVAPIWLPFSSIDRLGSQTQATVDLLRSWCLAPIWRPVC